MSVLRLLFIFGKKHDSYSQAPPLVKKIYGSLLSSLLQLIVEPTRTTECTLTDHILMNSPEKVIQSGVMEMGLSNHELIYELKKSAIFEMK